ncbi:unnamed protein product [Hermetia illucens]|uniref:RRM domain-containing protein n=1 Tax=Hermetia illucens TaxID=343691 RepID=A0A7R8YQW2_HERIL|nr:RNA-binding protein 45 [Hermetia illucens]CAD7082281.1 unnamed protein product [Hermetia illucens]
MSDYRHNRDERGSSLDDPPMSRLFVIHNRNNTEEEIREGFGQYGEIEDVWLLKDKSTGENKGIAYVKYRKTSDAALALEEMNGKMIGNSDRAIKVVVAANRQAGAKGKTENEQEKYFRLFLVVNKNINEEELREEFSQYGEIDYASVIRDRGTGQSKGFAYVKFKRFYHAALAFENCSPKYRAVFADPKTSKSSSGFDNKSLARSDDSLNNSHKSQHGDISGFQKMQSTIGQPTSLEVICSNTINQDQLWRLFDIIPGLDYCQLTGESNGRNQEATVVYTNPESAVYAKEKLHGLEYPPGERLIVKFGSETEEPSTNKRKYSFCNVDIPPPAPLATPDAVCVKRCFIVLQSNVSLTVLKNVFSTFGNLIDLYLLPNKNCGYVKYANEESAQKAIDVLNGAEICGVKIKVLEAQEQNAEGRKRMRRDD